MKAGVKIAIIGGSALVLTAVVLLIVNRNKK